VSLTQSVVPSESNPSAPPRPDASGNDGVMATGMDLLDAQGAVGNGASVLGT